MLESDAVIEETASLHGGCDRAGQESVAPKTNTFKHLEAGRSTVIKIYNQRITDMFPCEKRVKKIYSKQEQEPVLEDRCKKQG